MARHWLACVDLPNVRTTLEFHITAASGLTLLANGSLVSETVNGDGTKTAHWRLDQRCPTPITAASPRGPVQRRDVVGGLIHEYYRVAA